MPVIPDDTFAQVTLMFGGGATRRTIMTSFGLNGVTDGNFPDIAANVQASWEAHLKAQTMTAYTLDTILVKRGPNSTGPEYTTSPGIAGTQSGATIPPNCAFLFTKNTVHGGRHGKGRMFYPPLGEGFVDDKGNLAAGVATASSAAADAFRSGVGVDGNSMVLLHSDATTPYEVISLVTRGKVATQRRRMKG